MDPRPDSAVIDLAPATTRLAQIAARVGDDQLDHPTPMDAPVRQLVHHLLGLTVAFREAARKATGPEVSTPPSADEGPLPPTWRDDLRDRLGELAAAWADPAAWTGATMAGGVELPGEVAGLVALDEVLLHGWDLAVATGQEYRPDTAEAEAVLPMVTPPDDPEQAAAEREGLFGPPVPVPDDAPLFDRVLGLAGRDPRWSAPTTH